MPVAGATLLTGIVDEDGLPGGIADGAGDLSSDLDLETAPLRALFNDGADAPLTELAVRRHVGLPALTSDGVAVTYSVVGNVLTASAGATTVFTFTLDPTTGANTFTLLGQLDHPPGGNGKRPDHQTRHDHPGATDKDGDKATLPATAVSVPSTTTCRSVSGATSTGIVDEDGLPAGNARRHRRRSSEPRR